MDEAQHEEGRVVLATTNVFSSLIALSIWSRNISDINSSTFNMLVIKLCYMIVIIFR